ncbi:MAG: transglycosylase domain-containing protein [Fusobacteriaceae bacterium]
MKLINKIFVGILILITLSILAVGAGIGFYVYKNYKELPNIEELVSNYTPPIPTAIYDKNGVQIDSIYREKRELIKFDAIGQNLKDAFISVEDKNFYSHNGLNIKRNLSSIMANITAGRAVQGASTITQQLAKNAFLTNEKKLSRKVKEMLITFEIERIYTKDEILEKYLNEIYFGGGAYGIKAASNQFFKKSPAELNWAEAAMLAGIPNRPEKYNPRKNLENSKKRAYLILSELKKDGKITETDYQEGLKHKFILDKPGINIKKINLKTTTLIYAREARTESSSPDFTDLVYEFLRNEKNKKGERVFSEDMINNEGLKVYTTLDLEMQKVAKKVFQNSAFLKSRKGLQSGMATIDSQTGELRAVIGGIDYKVGNFNRSTMAKRQLGSASKPFLYFTALQDGMGMNSIVNDSRIKIGNWEPKNYNNQYHGNVTLLEALDRSLNIVSVKLLQKVGVQALKETVKNLGVDFKIEDYLTSALGTYDGTPLELALAYAPFSNGGFTVKPIVVTRIEDRFGKTIYSSDIKKEKVYDSLDISLINYMLQSSVKNGTSKRSAVTTLGKKPMAQGGKTGTTNENRTVWYAGMTPEYVTTIYMGYDNNVPIKGNVTGGSGPAPLWGEFYKELLKTKVYNPGEFTFIADNLKTGMIITQRLNSKNGLISENGRDFLVRSGQIALEKEYKFSEGVVPFFKPRYIETIENVLDKTIDVGNSIFRRLFGN